MDWPVWLHFVFVAVPGTKGIVNCFQSMSAVSQCKESPESLQQKVSWMFSSWQCQLLQYNFGTWEFWHALLFRWIWYGWMCFVEFDCRLFLLSFESVSSCQIVSVEIFQICCLELPTNAGNSDTVQIRRSFENQTFNVGPLHSFLCLFLQALKIEAPAQQN